jgi:hypothetical protein
LALAVALASLPTCRAEDALRLSILKVDSEESLSQEEIKELSKSGPLASLDQLPIAFYTEKAIPLETLYWLYSFQVVIENTGAKPVWISMLTSDWWDCITLRLVDASGKTYSIRRTGRAWAANGMVSWAFPPGGRKSISVCLSDEWYGFPPAPRHPAIVEITAEFRYFGRKDKPFDSHQQLGKPVTIRSKPTDVIFVSR